MDGRRTQHAHRATPDEFLTEQRTAGLHAPNAQNTTPPRQPSSADLTNVAFHVMFYAKGNTPRELISGMIGVRAVHSLSVGVEKLLPRIRPSLVPPNGRGLHDPRVAEHAPALVLATERDLPRRIRDQHARRWARPPLTRSLADTFAIIVGHGFIAAAIEHRLLACGAELVRVTSRRRA